jgi:hypothetical protein
MVGISAGDWFCLAQQVPPRRHARSFAFVKAPDHPVFQGLASRHLSLWRTENNNLALEALRIAPTALADTVDQPVLVDGLTVFDTPLGKVAFLVRSDTHIPEAAMVYSWLGARSVFWATELEPARDVYRYEQILRTRAMDELLTIVASDYAGRSSWYSHSVRSGRVGLPIGRSCVVTPAGEFSADTSYQAGPAVATVEIPTHLEKPLYLYPRSGSYLRQYDCRILTEPVGVPKLPLFEKRKARILLHPGGLDHRRSAGGTWNLPAGPAWIGSCWVPSVNPHGTCGSPWLLAPTRRISRSTRSPCMGSRRPVS